MEELLQKLLEADVLSEETKKELEEAFKGQLDEAIEAAKKDTAADVRADLTEQWVSERDALIEAVDSKVGEFLQAELEELKEDIERFRDLEAEQAEKLVEAKAAMADELKADLVELVEKIDAFLEVRLAAELEELREDIEEQRKNTFGRKVFEAFAQEYIEGYADEESAELSLREAQERLGDAEEALAESERKRAELERQIKMEEVLAPLSGRSKDIMEAILAKVDTAQLDEAYKVFIGRVLKEADSEKEGKVLAEGADEDNDDDKKDDDKKKSKKKDDDKDSDDDDDKKDVKEGVTKTGDTEEVITESEDPEAVARMARLKRLAGIK